MANTQEPHSKIYKTQGATAQVFSSGTEAQFTSGSELNVGVGATANFTSGTVKMPGSLAKGYIDLGPYLVQARELASAETMLAGTSAETAYWGGMLIGGSTGTTPGLALTSTGDQSLYLNWASANVDGIKLPPIFMPGDMSTAGGLTIGLYGETVGSATAADAKQAFDIRCWMDLGDTEMGATHADFTSTPSYKSIALASGDVSTGILNITLAPEAHAGRAIQLYGGRIDYTKKTS